MRVSLRGAGPLACHFDRPVLSHVEGLSAQPELGRSLREPGRSGPVIARSVKSAEALSTRVQVPSAKFQVKSQEHGTWDPEPRSRTLNGEAEHGTLNGEARSLAMISM